MIPIVSYYLTMLENPHASACTSSRRPHTYMAKGLMANTALQLYLELELRILPAAKKKRFVFFHVVHGNKCPSVQCSSAMHFKHCVIVSEHNGNQSCVTMWRKPTGQEKMQHMGWNLTIIRHWCPLSEFYKLQEKNNIFDSCSQMSKE